MRMKLSYTTPLFGCVLDRARFSSPAAQAVRERFVNRRAMQRSTTLLRLSASIPMVARPFCSAGTGTAAVAVDSTAVAAVDTASDQ